MNARNNKDIPGYESWHSMKQRCKGNRPDYKKYYLEKGITYDERWESFDSFIKDMGEKPHGRSLDRIDNSKGYSKDNCRWATPSEQCINRGIQKNNKSGVCGVKIRYDTKEPRYVPQLSINRKLMRFGSYKTLAEAVAVRKAMELKYFVKS